MVGKEPVFLGKLAILGNLERWLLALLVRTSICRQFVANLSPDRVPHG